jgi:hypothetical protein
MMPLGSASSPHVQMAQMVYMGYGMPQMMMGVGMPHMVVTNKGAVAAAATMVGKPGLLSTATAVAPTATATTTSRPRTEDAVWGQQQRSTLAAPFTEDEDAAILAAHAEHPPTRNDADNQWKLIVERIPGREHREVYNRFYGHLHKRLKPSAKQLGTMRTRPVDLDASDAAIASTVAQKPDQNLLPSARAAVAPATTTTTVAPAPARTTTVTATQNASLKVTTTMPVAATAAAATVASSRVAANATADSEAAATHTLAPQILKLTPAAATTAAAAVDATVPPASKAAPKPTSALAVVAAVATTPTEKATTASKLTTTADAAPKLAQKSAPKVASALAVAATTTVDAPPKASLPNCSLVEVDATVPPASKASATSTSAQKLVPFKLPADSQREGKMRKSSTTKTTSVPSPRKRGSQTVTFYTRIPLLTEHFVLKYPY